MKLQTIGRVCPGGRWRIVALGAIVCTMSTVRASDDALDVKLDVINARSEGVRDLTADFTEEKFTVLLKKPMVSKGRVKVIGARTRWDTTLPHATTMFTDDAEVVIYFPARETAEVYPIDRRLQPLVVSPIPRVATLRKHFDVEELSEASSGGGADTPSRLTLGLTPKDDALAEHIEDVRVRIDPELGIADRVEVIDVEGDRTVITFTNVRTNVGLSESDVQQALPAGTTIVRPLEAQDHDKPTEVRSNKP